MKKRIAAFSALLMLLALTGCITQPLGDLYALPKQAEEYYNLQQAIDAVMENASYAAPVAGDNRQAVQLRDLDDDGKNEAILFARTESEHPLKIYIFHRDGKVFSQIACLEGDGTSFDCVQYVQLDGAGGPELLVGRQLSDEVLQTLNVYQVSSQGATELLSVNYNEFVAADLTGAGNNALMLLRMESQERNGLVELYTWKADTLLCDQVTELSFSAENIRRIRSGNLEEGIPAVFVTGMLDETSYTTDVFALQKDKLTNITKLHGGSEASFIAQNVVYPADIDSDGEIELPKVLRQSGANNWLLQWSSLSMSGNTTRKLLTCQNSHDRWYIELLQRWQSSLLLSEQVVDGLGRVTTFSTDKGELFSIYALNGEDRETAATSEGRFLLGSKADVTFAVSIGKAGLLENLVPEDISGWFHLIPDTTNNET